MLLSLPSGLAIVASRFSKTQEADLRKALERLRTLAGRMSGYFGNTRETAAVRAHITLIEHELAPRPSFESLISQAEVVSAPLESLIEDAARRATQEMVLEALG